MISSRILAPVLFSAAVLALFGCNLPTDPPTGSGRTGAASAISPELRVTFLDVGQGDAALIQAPTGESLLIDGGPVQAGAGIVKALSLAGVKEVTLLIGSHPHEDHIGGLLSVLRAVPVKQALDPGYAHGTTTQRTYLQLLKSNGVKTTRARAGQTLALGPEARLEVLAPAEPLLKGTESDANNNSVVARMVHGVNRFLFTGDMEDAERARLLSTTSSIQLRSEVLKVAHHGSHNGTDAAFLRAVQPQYSVISLARDNDYGHPHGETLEELQSAGTRILRTDELGSVTFVSDGKRLELLPTSKSGTGIKESLSYKGKVIGNQSSKVYHTADCSSLPGASNRVVLKDAEMAETQGYHPHAKCMRAAESSK